MAEPYVPYDARRAAIENAPDLEKREIGVEGGKPSMQAAAEAAGIIKTEKPLTIIRRAWKKASATEREQITLWVTEQAGWIKK